MSHPAGFAWSWGPIVWLLGSEIQTLDTRTSGMSAGGWVGGCGRWVGGAEIREAAWPAFWLLIALVISCLPCPCHAVVFCNYLMSFVIGQSFLSMLW